MPDESLSRAIQDAKEAAEQVGDYKSETYLAVLLGRLMGQSAGVANRVSSPSQPPTPPQVTAGENQGIYTPPEIFADTHWKTDLDKVVLAGFYLENCESMDRFNINDLRSCLVRAKVQIPKNISLPVLQSVRRGWMMEVPEAKDNVKAYVLTQTGARRIQGMREGRQRTHEE